MAAPRRRNPRNRSFFAIYGLWRPEPQVPPAFWRVMRTPRRWMQISCSVLVAILLLEHSESFRGFFYRQFGRPIGLGLPLVLLVALGVMWIFYYRAAKRRFYEQVAKARFMVCWDCGYLMTGLPNMHECPECGRTFAAHLDTSGWKRWMEMDDPDEKW